MELGETRSGTLRDGLARALGDPTLEVAYWAPATGSYVDAAGRRVDISPGPERRVTPIDRATVNGSRRSSTTRRCWRTGLLDSVAAATRLAAANARLQAEVRTQVAELTASRLQLVRAGDEERRRLEQRLHDSAERRPGRFGRGARAGSRPPGNRARGSRPGPPGRRTPRFDTRRAEGAVVGLHPRVLAERGLPGRSPSSRPPARSPWTVAVFDGRPPEDIRLLTYFVCSEALANVAKRVGVACPPHVDARDGLLFVEVADDGHGGAVIGGGSGRAGSPTACTHWAERSARQPAGRRDTPRGGAAARSPAA